LDETSLEVIGRAVKFLFSSNNQELPNFLDLPDAQAHIIAALAGAAPLSAEKVNELEKLISGGSASAIVANLEEEHPKFVEGCSDFYFSRNRTRASLGLDASPIGSDALEKWVGP
jgi:hypothetical protein